MLSPLKPLSAWVLVLAVFVASLTGSTAASAKESLVSLLPKSERSFFVLDVSNSTNVQANWTKSLRPSIIKKLRDEPFGYPTGRGKKEIKPPVDIFVSSITANSIDAPIFPVVTIDDARKMWGLIDRIGTNPTQKRLEKIVEDIFGGDGAFTKLSESFLKQPISIPSMASCKSSTLNSISKGFFLRDLSTKEKSDSAETICELGIGISERIKAIDAYFENPDCGSKVACSDVVGAILSVSYAAADLYEQSPKSQLCIAIASDMLNNVPGLKKDSLLNSKAVVESAKSISDAKEKGLKVGQLVGITFPKNMNIRVFVLGQGSGKKPLSLDKNAMLKAYWEGFFESAGIKNSKPSPSLDQACSK